jgi:hypothetical protein
VSRALPKGEISFGVPQAIDSYRRLIALLFFFLSPLET